ncbi:11012_t:CDS:2 [Dentiscutata heterogama]|uniref:11012_t:CDS:1 n=1 Tax=Dentiscutata heterogama TaxID=1316150 RepID=A0ACA9KD39_9GLOM|nr:11012_t:CDS:2 [Dentiscutata heterogama]
MDLDNLDFEPNLFEFNKGKHPPMPQNSSCCWRDFSSTLKLNVYTYFCCEGRSIQEEFKEVYFATGSSIGEIDDTLSKKSSESSDKELRNNFSDRFTFMKHYKGIHARKWCAENG